MGVSDYQNTHEAENAIDANELLPKQLSISSSPMLHQASNVNNVR